MLSAIVGAQAQEPRAGRLQVRARAPGLTAADVESARVDERSIVRTWLMRMTIHLVSADDHGWLAPLYSERITTWSLRRLEALGVTERQRNRGLAAARKAIAAGPARRSEVLEAARRAGFPVSAETRTHLPLILVAEGTACVGPDAGREGVLVAKADWIGRERPREREASLGELARGYIKAFAPATDRDFAYWSGLPLGECRLGIERIAGELDAVRCGEEELLVPRGFTARAPRSATVRLLPAFDTYLLGYRSRRHATDERRERRILPGGGVLRPTVCVDGRLVGLWSSKRSRTRLRIELEPFEPLAEDVLAAIDAEARDIGRFEGLDGALA